MYYIYVIQNSINNKLYIGQAENPSKRWGEHKWFANQYLKNNRRKYTQRITKALVKYGVDNFIFTILQEAKTLEEVNELEVFWIKLLKSRERCYGYNVLAGGRGKSPKYTLKEFSKGEKEFIVKEYLIGDITITALASKYECHWNEIHRVLERSDKNITIKRDWGRLFTDEQEQEICNRYSNDKIPITKLADIYDTSEAMINKTLKKHNVETLGNAYFSKGRRHSEATEFKKGQDPHNKLFTIDQEKEICDRYVKEKLNTVQLGKIYNCHKSVVSRLLERSNISIRKRGKFSDEDKANIIAKYGNGLSSLKLAKEYGVNKSSVLRLIRKYKSV